MEGGTLIAILAAAAIAVAVAALVLVLRGARGGGAGAEQARQLLLVSESLIRAQAELAGRVSQLAESQAQAHANLNKTLEQSATRTAGTLGELRKHLTVIDQAQKNISELTGQVVSLQDILDNKQARGAFGEIQLNDIVVSALPPSAYRFQETLGNGKRADCLIDLPNPPGPIVIDAKVPLESYHALRAAEDDSQRTAARRGFAEAIQKHVRDISERYIVPGETAESALMFLPSEAVYAELHAAFPEVVAQSYRARVWIVSPTTLMATLNTVRAVLKDVRMREQAGVIQTEVIKLIEDVVRLDDRVAKLQKHFDQATEDMRQARISTEKISAKAERIGELQFEDRVEDDATAAAELTDTTPRLVGE